jgi:nucleoside-diphosphate-sugar epimerase
MRILVTGSNGFIGRNLISKLEANQHQVFTTNGIDIRDSAAVNRLVELANPEICYHLAAYGNSPYHTDVNKIYETIINGTKNLINSLKLSNCKLMINASTSSVYGKKYLPMKETDFLEPDSHYAIAKTTTENICSFESTEKLAICSLRLFSVYGPYEKEYRLIPTIIKQALNNEVITLANPKTARDFVFVDDVIDLMLQVKPIHNKKIFNIGTGHQSTIQDVADAVISLAQSNSKIIYDSSKNRPWDTDTWVADMRHTSPILGIPPTTLRIGLNKTINWTKETLGFK